MFLQSHLIHFQPFYSSLSKTAGVPAGVTSHAKYFAGTFRTYEDYEMPFLPG